MEELNGGAEEDQSVNFKYVHNTLAILCSTLSDLKLFSSVTDRKAKHFVNNTLMKKYHFTLMYTFVMEYCKLTEDISGVSSENHASIKKLNKEILNKYNLIPKEVLLDNEFGYTSIYRKVSNEIKSIRKSDIYKKIKNLRDKKLAHIDKDLEIHNFNFEMYYFTNEELIIIKDQFDLLRNLINLCSSPFKSLIKGEYKNNPISHFFSESIEIAETVNYSESLKIIQDAEKYEKFYFDNHSKI